MNRKILSKLSLILLTGLLIFSCTPTKKLKFVRNVGDDIYKNRYENDRSEKTIQPFDYLFIRIFSLDEKTNNIFNGKNDYAYQTELVSYAVDDKGNIDFPFIGNINVKDLTVNQAKEKIEKSLGLYLRDISVIVRYIGNKITVLGEVIRPGQYQFYDEKVTVFQALGFATGVNTYGDLSNITLIREKDNIINYNYLDLTKKNIATSEYYYLLPNDIIIVNPLNAKYRELRDYSINVVSTLVGTISTLVTMYYLIQLK